MTFVGVLMLMLVLALIGAATWAIVTYIPMIPGVKIVIIVVAVICAILYALNVFGIHLGDVPRVH